MHQETLSTTCCVSCSVSGWWSALLEEQLLVAMLVAQSAHCCCGGQGRLPIQKPRGSSLGACHVGRCLTSLPGRKLPHFQGELTGCYKGLGFFLSALWVFSFHLLFAILMQRQHLSSGAFSFRSISQVCFFFFYLYR